MLSICSSGRLMVATESAVLGVLAGTTTVVWLIWTATSGSDVVGNFLEQPLMFVLTANLCSEVHLGPRITNV